MSWNVTGTADKETLCKHVREYFGNLLTGTQGTPQYREYEAARTTLLSLIDAAPEDHLLILESWGSASYNWHMPFYDCHLNLKLVAPTMQ